MRTPPQVTFQQMRPRPALQDDVRGWVRFQEEAGGDGAPASTVEPIGEHGHHTQ